MHLRNSNFFLKEFMAADLLQAAASFRAHIKKIKIKPGNHLQMKNIRPQRQTPNSQQLTEEATRPAGNTAVFVTIADSNQILMCLFN